MNDNAESGVANAEKESSTPENNQSLVENNSKPLSIAGDTEVRKVNTSNNQSKVSEDDSTYPNKQNIAVEESKGTLKQANINEHSAKFVGAGLWEQIREHTSLIEVEEEGDYNWPETRKQTEKVIEQLFQKQILFIQSISEDWLFRGVQRLATVLQTHIRFENVLVRITRNSQATTKLNPSQLEFGFWNRQRRLSYPVVVVVSASRYDFLQKFLDQRKETVLNEFIAELRKLNLYLVCEVENTIPNQELFLNVKPWIKTVYAFWEIPVVKLHILQFYKHDGHKAYAKLEDAGIFAIADEYHIYSEIIKHSYENVDEIITNLPGHIIESKSDVGTKRAVLQQLMAGDDFIKQVVVFCGAFFNGLYYPDFFNLISELLEGETKMAENVVKGPDESANPVATAQTLQLREMWEKNAGQYLNDCLLETVKETGNQRVDFLVSSLANEMSEYITVKKYAFFHRIYKKFEKAGLLTDLNISEKLESYIIRFFSLSARLDTNTHNASWLKAIVYALWRGYAADLTKSETYDDLVTSLRRKKLFGQIVFDRIPLIISGLLTNNNAEYREIIKQFFRLLLNEDDAKKMAIILASYLYKEYRLTTTFDTEDLMSYFKRTLEEGNWEDSFFSYDALLNNMSYTELWEETNAWINNEEISDDSWTKQFAYLYQLDFILETFYRYFRQFKGEGLYELWENAPEGDFPESFKNIFKSLVSEKSQKSLSSILESQANRDRLIFRIKLLEGVESDKIIIMNARLLEPYNTAISLIADVIEIWFYLLTQKIENLKPDSQPENLLKAYIQMSTKIIDGKTLSKIRRYWTEKTDFYTSIIKGLSEEKEKIASQSSYKQQLQKRRVSLRILKNYIQISR